MSTIYDIAGTSSNSFMLNNKCTLLQGDELPTKKLGHNGDVYFQSNGAIYAKRDGTWLNLTSASLPDAASGVDKIVYSNGNIFTLSEKSLSDIAYKNSDNVYTGNNKFNNISSENKIQGGSLQLTAIENLNNSLNKIVSLKDDGTFCYRTTNEVEQDMKISSGKAGDIVASVAIEREGGLLCNGASVSKLDYPELFKIIEYKYGGSEDNFNLPDLRGYWLNGAGNVVALGNKVEAGLPNITGDINGLGSSSGAAVSGALYQDGYYGHRFSASGSTGGKGWANAHLNASKSNVIYGKSTTVRPQSFGVNFFILY